MMTFGYLPDLPIQAGQKPDHIFGSGLLAQVSDGDVDLREHTTETQQYGAGSCAGCASADSVEILNSLEGRPKVQLSRLFIYTLARNFMDSDGDGRSDIDKDKGTTLRLCFEVLSKFGVCREDLPIDQGGWPYELETFSDLPKRLNELPSLRSMRAATGHRIHSYYRIEDSDSARLDLIIAALRANHPVVFGTDVSEAFTMMRGSAANLVGPPKGPIAGGHAMVVVGYLKGQGFIIKNSWGKSWGLDGFCVMKPEYLAWERTRDLWVPTLGTSFK
jgi:hypothetical protein